MKPSDLECNLEPLRSSTWVLLSMMKGPLHLDQMLHSHLLVVVDPLLLSQRCDLLLVILLPPPQITSNIITKRYFFLALL